MEARKPSNWETKHVHAIACFGDPQGAAGSFGLRSFDPNENPFGFRNRSMGPWSSDSWLFGSVSLRLEALYSTHQSSCKSARHHSRYAELMHSFSHEKTGRNDPCPCGSGKKYKHCCLANSTIAFPGPKRSDTPWNRQRDASDHLTAQLQRH